MGLNPAGSTKYNGSLIHGVEEDHYKVLAQGSSPWGTTNNKCRRTTIMSKNSNIKKAEQLGMPIGTASGKLRKSLFFEFLKRLNLHYCFQCGSEICSEDELSIEHKIPYLDSENPVKLFFDLDNIAFSHLSCNCGASRREVIEHGTSAYTHGRCRCDICRKANTEKQSKYRNNGFIV